MNGHVDEPADRTGEVFDAAEGAAADGLAADDAEEDLHQVQANGADFGFDASFGAQLIRAFKDAGLVNIAAEVHLPLVAGGTEKWAPGIAEFLGEMMVGKGLCTASEVESFLAMTADPSVHYGPSLMVTAWGQRPA